MKKPFVDLDALVSESVKFKFKGETHEIKPITVEAFMRFNNAWFDLQYMIETGDIDETSSMDVSVNLIKSVCDSLPEDRIRKEMAVAQIGALVQLIIETITGRDTDEEDIKKKVLKFREKANHHR